MKIELTREQYRRLLDLVFLGNFFINDIRDKDRITEYDDIESLIFSHCKDEKMNSLIENLDGKIVPSQKYREGGILEVVNLYEDTTFFEILAQELTLRECNFSYPSNDMEWELYYNKLEEYLNEFKEHGMENIDIQMNNK